MELSSFLASQNYNIILISETWLTDEQEDSEIFLPSYQLFRSDRKAPKGQTKHGGVMIGIMHSFHCQKISLPEESQGDAVGCIVNFQNRKILIVSFYNPPQTSHYHLNDEMIKLIFKEIETLMSQVDATIIYGDFNLDIAWNIRSSENCESQSFLDVVDHLELEQHIDFPTAATGTLDLLFSKGELNLVSTKVKPLSISSMSNHFPITAKFEIRKVNNVFRSYHNESKMFSYCKADFKALNADIIDKPFQGFCWSNPDVLLSDWYKWLNIKIERHVPTRTRHRARLAPWITQSTSNIIKKLNTAKKKYPALHNRVLSLQKECDFAVEQDQINFESELSDSRSTDKLFKFYRTFKSSRIPSKLIYGSKEAQSNAEKVELFADFFDDNFSKHSDPPSLGEPQNLSTTKLDDFGISEQRIQNIEVQKDLGLLVSRIMKWNETISNNISKALKTFYMLKRNTPKGLPMRVKLNIFKAMILQVLLYGSSCWAASIKMLRLIEKVQEKELTWVNGRNDYVTNLMQCNILPLTLYMQLLDLLFMSKMLNGYYKIDATEYFCLKEFDRATRLSEKPFFELPKIKKSIYQQEFWLRTCKLVNILPNSIDYSNHQGLKPRLLKHFWNYFMTNYRYNDISTWKLA